MKKFTGTIRTNKQGSDCHFDFEVADDATEKEIDEIARECAFEFIDYWYEEDQNQ